MGCCLFKESDDELTDIVDDQGSGGVEKDKEAEVVFIPNEENDQTSGEAGKDKDADEVGLMTTGEPGNADEVELMTTEETGNLENGVLCSEKEFEECSLHAPGEASDNVDVYDDDDEPEPSVKTKSEIVPDVQIFKDIDGHVRKAPKSARKDVETLATYLTKPSKNSLETIRSFHKWIQLNVSYDVEAFLNKSTEFTPSEADHVIQIGIAVCEGYSNLFRDLCRAAGVPVRRVSGYSKGYGFTAEKGLSFDDKPDHAWNAVFVCGEWRLVDSTWGTGYIDDDGNFERNNNEFYFLTDPEHFATSHFPYMKGNLEKSEKWQLLEEPLSLDAFNKVVMIQSKASEIGLELVSHRNVMIEVVKEETVVISFSDGPKLSISALLKGEDGKRLKKHIMMTADDNQYSITVQPPFEGTFILNIYGRRDETATNRRESARRSNLRLNHLVKYVIKCVESDEDLIPFPVNSFPWGPVKDVAVYGLSEDVKKKVTFLAENGETTIELPLSNGMITSMSADLTHAEEELPEADDFALLEAGPSTVFAKVRTPLTGRYRLSIFAKRLSSRGSKLDEIIRYLVECEDTPYSEGPFPKSYSCVLRYQVKLVEPNVKHLPENSDVIFKLTSPLLRTIFVRKQVFRKVSDDQFEFVLRTSGKGEKITIYGSEKEGPFDGLFEFLVI